MFADPEIPVRMADPGDVEVVAKIETGPQLRPAQQLVEDDAVINPLDPDLAPFVFVEELTPAFSYTR